MIDLMALPKRYLDQLGPERVAEIVGVSLNTLSMWKSRDSYPLHAVQKLLESDPTPLHEIKPLYVQTEQSPRLSIILPSNRKPEPDTIKSLTKMFNSETMVFEPETFNSLYHVRNMAAARFLRSGNVWSYWSDDDMIHPCGDAAWFKQATGKKNFPDVYAGINSILRLMVHGKKMVSGCYVGRKIGASPQFAGGDSPAMRQLIARGPSQNLLKPDWCGFGGVLVHREVFTDIIRTQPEIETKNPYIRSRLGYEYGFFNPIEQDFGDDISFCARARKAGHEIHVDCSVMLEHVGNRSFGYEDLR